MFSFFGPPSGRAGETVNRSNEIPPLPSVYFLSVLFPLLGLVTNILLYMTARHPHLPLDVEILFPPLAL